MNTRKPKNNLKEIIVNNPHAQQRIEMKKIEKEIKEEERGCVRKDNNDTGYAMFY